MLTESRRDRVRGRLPATAWIATALLCFSFASCGDETTAPDEDPVDDPPVELVIELGVGQARSAERIGITGIPPEASVWAVVTAESGEQSIAFLERGAGRGGDRLLVPLHPGAPMDGGAVEIEVTNGANISSNRVSLTIDPLPAAPGAFAALVSDLELLLDGWLAQAGTTREDLRGAPLAELPVTHLQLLWIHNTLDRPDNANSLRAFADGDIPLFDGITVDRDLLDALAAASGTPGFVGRKLAFVDTLTAPELPIAETTRQLGGSRRGGGGCFEGPTFGIGPDDCETLAGAMRYQSALAIEAASAAQDVEDTVQGIFFTAMTFTPAAPYAAGVAATFWAAKTIEAGAQGLYPSQFVSDATDFDADSLEFPEDFTDDGLWNHFRVTAVSDGWRFDRAAFEALMQILGAAGSGPGDIVDALEDQVEGAALQGAIDAITDFITTESTNLAISELVGDSGLVLEYCPQTWGGINCTGAPYSVGSSSSSLLDVDDPSRTFEPTDVGSAQLRVETIAGAFGAAHTAEDKVITTNAIEVIIDPFDARVGTDETVEFTVRVTNAIDPRVEWTSTGDDFTPGPDGASLVTPSSPWNPAIEVRAVSLAETGLRKDGKPVREDVALVTYADSLVIVQVTPQYDCISNDETVDLEAEVIGLENATVAWSIESGWGSVSSTGPRSARYTPPPAGTTSDVILAQVVERPEAVDRAEVRVSACTCYYDIAITGGSSWQESGGDIIYHLLVLEEEVALIQFTFALASPEIANFAASVGPTDDLPAPVPGQTGDWRLNFVAVIGGTNYSSSQSDDDTAVLLSISDFTTSFMEGRMHGIAANRDHKGDIVSTVVVDVSFRAGQFTGSWPCE